MVVQWWTPQTVPSPPPFSKAGITMQRSQSLLNLLVALLSMPIDPTPFSPANPHFVPLASSRPIPVYAALLPPLTYYIALTLLPPVLSNGFTARLVSLCKFLFAAISVYSFAILPFRFHVPGSAILTYQLGLIGCFGACRSFDIFFLSYPRVPKRLAITTTKEGEEGKDGRVYDNSVINERWPTKPDPRFVAARLWYALDLMISMRGVGWDFGSPDVRNDINPWQRPSRWQLKRALFTLAPVLLCTMAALRAMSVYIDAHSHSSHSFHSPIVQSAGIDRLPLGLRPLFVACTGVALYALFDFGYTIVSAIALPFIQSTASVVQTGSPSKGNDVVPNVHNLDFFPLLNPLGLTAIRSVRSFWSKAWHRLFHRAFLIYGIIPFRNLALHIEYAVSFVKAKINGQPAPAHPFEQTPFGHPTPSRYADPGRALRKGEGDWGKVMGAFIASGVIHAISERAALGGRVALPHQHVAFKNVATHPFWSLAHIVPPFSGAGELSFFVLNGVAVIVETAFGRLVTKNRQRRQASLTQWYDIYVQLAWTLTVLLTTGELFVEGWITSGLINEITFVKG